MTATPVNSGKALYYPFFGVRDSNWLKASLLYWDDIRRIGPGSFHHETPDARLVRDAGLLRETEPSPYLSGAAKRFREFVLPLTTQPEMFHHANLDAIQREMRYAQGGSEYRLRLEKMDHDLRNELQALEIIVQDEEWLVMRGWIGAAYMTCLAIEISQSIGAPPVTHVSTLENLGEYLAFGTPAKNKVQDSESVLLQLGISLPTPYQMKEIETSKIIKLHDKYASERRRFRHLIQEIVLAANGMTDPNAIFDYLDDKRQEIKEAVDDHAKALSYLNIKSMDGILRLSAPTSITGLAAAIITPELGLLATSIGFTVSALKWWADRRAEVAKENKSPYHYLLTLEKEFPKHKPYVI